MAMENPIKVHSHLLRLFFLSCRLRATSGTNKPTFCECKKISAKRITITQLPNPEMAKRKAYFPSPSWSRMVVKCKQTEVFEGIQGHETVNSIITSQLIKFHFSYEFLEVEICIEPNCACYEERFSSAVLLHYSSRKQYPKSLRASPTMAQRN